METDNYVNENGSCHGEEKNNDHVHIHAFGQEFPDCCGIKIPSAIGANQMGIREEATTTFIDVLSEDERFNKLIQNLQRTQLIPYLNHLPSATLFAPINEAFEYEPFITKERMLYHLLNLELRGDEFFDGQLLTTHLEIVEKLGKGEIGQKLKVEISDGKYVGNAKIINTDLMADNGVIHVIDKVLKTPLDAFGTLTSIDQLHIFVNYLRNTKLDRQIKYGNHITVFAVTDDAINHQFKSVEREYLTGECGGGINDATILIKHQLHFDKVLYSSSVEEGTTELETEQGEPLIINRDEHGNIRVSNGLVTLKDMLAENGVIHVVNNISIPQALFFNVHKYLCGMRATKIVSGFMKYKLDKYIEDRNASYTIFAPRDDLYDENARTEVLKYHIVKGKYNVKDLKNHMFIKTELRTEELKNHRQRSEVAILPNFVKENDSISRTEILINDASVIGDPVEIGNSIIYLISKTLSPPSDVMSYAIRNRQLNAFVSAIFASDMQTEVQNANWVTIFAPTNSAFTKIGLITSYLLHPDGKEDLRSVVEYHMLNETILTEDIPQGESKYSTIDGNPLSIIRDGEKINVEIANGTSTIVQPDILTSSGVLHIVDSVQLPPSLHITLDKILKGIGATTMLKILKIANLSEILKDPSEPFIIISPTDNAFREIIIKRNISLDEPDEVSRLVKLHVIPGTSPELSDGKEFPTLLSNEAKLIIRKDILHGVYKIEVKGEFNLFGKAKITGIGKTWNGGAVYEVDKVLLPRHQVSQIGSAFFGITIGILIATFISMGGGLGLHHYQRYRRRVGYQPIS
ncbi:14558_t:CDS:2 [Dentiscutata erythropus]|uniref:14558_t:CDS:1 n=1 Tax=Dentiscutata erythropus TaxID=1348616 RepID=A0A9N9BX11_9GLOM|nr:14558_t:CDS:2 [Dentiscutata erythropus]